MCDPATGGMLAMGAMSFIQGMNQPDPPKPAAITPPPQPQQAKAPDIAKPVNGGTPGAAPTMLTGPQGVDPSTLLLGKPTLTGGKTLLGG